MKIFIEARSLAAAAGGVKTYTWQLLRHLVRLATGDNLTVIYDRKPQTIIKGAQQLVVPLRHEVLLYYWLMRQLPAAVRQAKPDIIHFTKADVPTQRIAPTVVTIYDVIPLLLPATQSILRRWYWPAALKRAAANSDHILTISEASKKDIVKFLDVAPEKITVTPLAIDLDHFRPAPISAINGLRLRLGLSQPYILFVGTRDRRKNIVGLLRAFGAVANTIPHQLVIAGGPARYADDSKAEVSRLALTDKVKFIEHVSYDDLPILYSGADLFVWPAIYEGWGFPPQEAMACGTPVIVSDGGSLPEVVGEAGLIVPFKESTLSKRSADREFVTTLSAAMVSVLNNQNRRRQMTTAGLTRARLFSWQSVADQTMAVYRSVGFNK